MSCRGQPSCAGFRRSNTKRSRPGARHGEQRCCRPRLPAHSAGSRPQVSARRVRKGAERPPRPHPVYAGVVAAAGGPTRAGMAPGWPEPSRPHRRSRRGRRGRWGPRPRRDGRDRSVRGLRACAGMSRWLQAPVPPLARRMSPRRFPRFRVYNETGTDQTDPQSNGHHRKFVRSNGLRLNGRRGTMVSPLLEAGLVYRDVLSLSRGTKGKKLSRIQV